jgi:hypothetical protein
MNARFHGIAQARGRPHPGRFQSEAILVSFVSHLADDGRFVAAHGVDYAHLAVGQRGAAGEQLLSGGGVSGPQADEAAELAARANRIEGAKTERLIDGSWWIPSCAART